MNRAPFKALEISVFVAVALAIHLAIFWARTDDAGQFSGGGGGDAAVTIAGASASMRSRVAEWEDAPDAIDAPEDLAPPDPIRTLEEAPVEMVAPQTREPAQAPSAPQSPESVQPQTEAPAPPSHDLARTPAPLEPPRAGLATPAFAPPEAEPQRPSSTPPPMRQPTAVAPIIDRAAMVPPNDAAADGAAAPSSAPTPRTKPRPPMPPKTARAASPPTDPPRRAPAAPAKDALAKAAPEPSSGSGTESAQASVAAGSGGGPQDGAGDAAETAGGASSGGAELAKIWGGRIRREVERKKTYPRSLRRSGSVLIAMTVERGGRLMQAKIQESSGSDGLDAAAMTAVKAAAPYVAAPAGLSGTSFKFVLPVVFKR